MRIVFRRHMGAAHWLAFFGLILLSWSILYVLQRASIDPELTRIYGADFLASLCAANAGEASYGVVFFMWVLMSAAMMAPTLFPALRVYDDLTETSAANGAGFLLLFAGYLAVWIGFSALAAWVQLVLARAGVLSAEGQSLSLYLTAALLGGAGLYQFSSVKEACLSKCRAPLVFFMQNWKPGNGHALKMGSQLGLTCLGCCWALMTLAFVGGTMNLVWMGVATVLMVLEKLPEIGRYTTAPMGGALILSSVAVTTFAVFGN